MASASFTGESMTFNRVSQYASRSPHPCIPMSTAGLATAILPLPTVTLSCAVQYETCGEAKD